MIKRFNENFEENWEETDGTVSMFYFNPNDYGEEYILCSTSKEAALNTLINWFKSGEERNYGRGLPFDDGKTHMDYEYEKWKKATVNNLPDKYTIDIYRVGEVLRSELA